VERVSGAEQCVTQVHRALWHEARSASLWGMLAWVHRAWWNRVHGVWWRRVVRQCGRAGLQAVCDGGMSVLSVSLSLPLFISLTHSSPLHRSVAGWSFSSDGGSRSGNDETKSGHCGARSNDGGPDLATAQSLKLDVVAWTQWQWARLGSTVGSIGLA
jgi:hypothetical protein